MGTFRSTYPIMPESNQSTSIPPFAWFHPGNYLGATRGTGFNVFQGNPTNPEGVTAIPIRSMAPVNEAPTNLDPEAQPTKPTKKPKTSKKPSNDGTMKEFKPKKPPKKIKSSVSP